MVLDCLVSFFKFLLYLKKLKLEILESARKPLFAIHSKKGPDSTLKKDWSVNVHLGFKLK